MVSALGLPPPPELNCETGDIKCLYAWIKANGDYLYNILIPALKHRECITFGITALAAIAGAATGGTTAIWIGYVATTANASVDLAAGENEGAAAEEIYGMAEMQAEGQALAGLQWAKQLSLGLVILDFAISAYECYHSLRT